MSDPWECDHCSVVNNGDLNFCWHCGARRGQDVADIEGLDAQLAHLQARIDQLEARESWSGLHSRSLWIRLVSIWGYILIPLLLFWFGMPFVLMGVRFVKLMLGIEGG